MSEFALKPLFWDLGVKYRLWQEKKIWKPYGETLHLLGTANPVCVSVQGVQEALATHVPYFDRFVFRSCSKKLAIG